ncbi:hypothetical protein UPYG_G00280010 [Umbra pygmaea]|uniref:Proteinase-activated receptor 1 n=1 Tax=Umbra pygmaea TaxID=75934 RepID=A0ABD0W4M0_UMBPY
MGLNYCFATKFLKTFIFLIAAIAADVPINGSSILRTFTRLETVGTQYTDEPISFHEWSTESWILLNNGSVQGPMENGSTRKKTGSEISLISETAINFLTGRLSTIFIPTLYTIVFLISVPLNAIAMVTFVKRIRPMKPAVIYMLNLAAADLLFALLLPFKIVYHYSGNNWGFGEGMCRLVTAAFYCNMYCTVLLITCISVDRLLAVAYPIDSLAWRRPFSAALACGLMWVLAVGGSLALVLTRQTVYDKPLDITTCHDIQDQKVLTEIYVFFFPVLSCTLYFLPLVVIAICYSWVVRVLNKSPCGVVGSSRQKARAVVMAVTVLVVCVVCFTPTNTILLAHYLQIAGMLGGNADATHVAYLLSLCLGSISCCLDPIIYCFGSSQCRRQLAGVLGSCAATEGGKSLASSSGFSRSSTSKRMTKVDAFQTSLNSQYNKLLV